METINKQSVETLQLKIIAINILDGCESHIQKNSPYTFYGEYVLTECNKIGEYKVSYDTNIKGAYVNSTFYTNRWKVDQLISICAIVGKNGSGKSALIDILLRLINNYSYKIVGRETSYVGAQLKWVNGVRAELYFAIGEKYYLLKQSGDKDTDIKLYKYDDRWIKQSDAKKTLNDFFYTILLNYSLYAFNSLDYPKEWEDSKHESSCWLNGAFHKNDGYKAPVVLNPMRTRGDIDINRENKLAKDRLISLFFTDDENLNRSFTDINDKHSVDSLSVSLDSNRVREKYDRIKKEWLNDKPEDEVFFDELKNKIIELWRRIYKFKPESANDQEFSIATLYLAYKTISIAQRYDAYDNFDCLQSSYSNPWDQNRYDALEKLIHEIDKDSSHITFKLRQTLAFLKFRHIKTNNRDLHITISDFSKITKGKSSNKWKHIDFVPAPCFKTEIILKEKNSQDRYPFSMLSSGEKQFVYTASTILYHLRNLNSVRGNQRRVKYRHFNIIMDEIELYFHPEFQRRFINYILTCIRDLKFNEIDSINIIMATHSPFILSDIPELNVIFLQDGKVRQDFVSETFGANIHTLYKDNFFIEGMPIGEFAKGKINQLFEKVRNISQHDDVIYNEIRLVGEPLLRTQLLKLYEQNCPGGLVDKIIQLEAELQSIKNRHND